MLQPTLEALAGLATEDFVRCERLAVSDRVEAIALVGDMPFTGGLREVRALIVLPAHDEDDVGFAAVSNDLEVAFQPCAGGF